MAVVDVPRSGAPAGGLNLELVGWRAFAWTELGAVSAILAMSAGLNLVALDQEGFGNTYYAATSPTELHADSEALAGAAR
jgi:hypothetical protein